MSDCLQPHGLYSPWNSPGHYTGVGSHSFLQGIFPTQRLNPGLPYCRWIVYCLSHGEAQEYQSGQPIPSPGDLPNPGIEPESCALQVDSLPTELSGKQPSRSVLLRLKLHMANSPPSLSPRPALHVRMSSVSSAAMQHTTFSRDAYWIVLEIKLIFHVFSKSNLYPLHSCTVVSRGLSTAIQL